jgi:hypothetical protein
VPVDDAGNLVLAEMTTQPRSQADRLRVMKAIYVASGGSEYAIVPGPQLLEDLGLSDQELADACRYRRESVSSPQRTPARGI